MTALRSLIVLCTGIVFISSCSVTEPKTAVSPYEPQDYIKIVHPEWSKNASIYQLNIRQFTPEGTFKAATLRLDELQHMGFDILWLMPIHPIGEENRKGNLGSPYAVKDYFGVNSEFGTPDDLKALIARAHELNMYVLFDWVANHTAWDNPLRYEHPDWYEKDHEGNFRPTPWWDWSDIIDLDYSQTDLREYMTNALKYWVEEYDIDGYRADVAGFVPVDFWEQVRRELDAIKPVFMLAEWEMRDLHARSFDMTYAWSWQEAMHHVISHEGDLHKLFYYYSWNESAYPKDTLRMTFVTNHDMNAWEGTVFERYGDATEAAIVLSIVGEGMPLAYNGLEAGNNKRLAFFERDPIEWKAHRLRHVWTRYNQLLNDNTALWHGKHGATMLRVDNTDPEHIFSFVRQDAENKVLAVFNFTSGAKPFESSENLIEGEYFDVELQHCVSINKNKKLLLPAWGYRVFVQYRGECKG
ncbi:alpha-amylase family glycosyl hydrolase [Alteromonas facilis]|uniref:alpha-amylase family glycosyl hydrolase n=1 Tax=Alteromonas facilis TaxID=2048004 RepID=UPI000C2864B5|nr:alpha-amylase family glycosyl hydrolase [Alteromonas facilis]